MRLLIPCILALATGLTGCTTSPSSDPNRYSMQPADVAHLRVEQSVNLRNAFDAPSILTVQAGITQLVFDRKQLTDTAITMLSRTFEKHGIKVTGEGQKTVTLLVRPAGLRMRGIAPVPMRIARLFLDATFGDGSNTSIVSEEGTPGDFDRAMDGAILAALKALVQDEKFLAYMQR